jgi:hypothetical protein
MANQLLQPQESLERLSSGELDGQGLALGRTATGKAIQLFWITGHQGDVHDIYLQVTETPDDLAVEMVGLNGTLLGEQTRVKHKVMRAIDELHIVTNNELTDDIVSRLTNPQVDEDKVKVAIEKLERDDSFLSKSTRQKHPPNIVGLTVASADMRYFVSTAIFDLDEKDKNGYHDRVSRYAHVGRLIEDIEFSGNAIGVHTYGGDDLAIAETVKEALVIPLVNSDDPAVHAEMLWESLDQNSRLAVAAKVIDPSSGSVMIGVHPN